jgi:hypothetical protein
MVEVEEKVIFKAFDESGKVLWETEWSSERLGRLFFRTATHQAEVSPISFAGARRMQLALNGEVIEDWEIKRQSNG